MKEMDEIQLQPLMTSSITAESVEVVQEIGSGGYSRVYSGVFQGMSDVSDVISHLIDMLVTCDDMRCWWHDLTCWWQVAIVNLSQKKGEERRVNHIIYILQVKSFSVYDLLLFYFHRIFWKYWLVVESASPQHHPLFRHLFFWRRCEHHSGTDDTGHTVRLCQENTCRSRGTYTHVRCHHFCHDISILYLSNCICDDLEISWFLSWHLMSL